MKNLLLLSISLLFACNITAQLHVQPNTVASTDSYIFVDGEILFVEDDIRLIKNENADSTEASIYLRNGGQIIQGDKSTSANSGDGLLSVYQTSPGNSYHYTYWNSPVATASLSTIGNTNYGIGRIYDAETITKSNLAATTTAHNSTPSPNLTIARGWIHTMRASSTYSSWVHIGNTNNLAPGEGFTMRGTGTGDGTQHTQLWDFRGRPMDGDIELNVAAEQFTLAGNPYPSALDLKALLDENPDIEARILYWDQDRTINSHFLTAISGGYGVWVPGGGASLGGDPENTAGIYTRATFYKYKGDGTPNGVTNPGGPGEEGNDLERRFAPIGQGFMVEGDRDLTAPGTLTIKNTMRRFVKEGAGNYSEFQRLIPTASVDQSADDTADPTTMVGNFVMPTLRFHTTINDSYVRDMVLMFSDATTKGKDRGYDGKSPAIVPSGDVFWNVENETKPYVIQGRPFSMDDEIPLGLKSGNGTTTYSIEIVDSHHLDGVKIYLKDDQENTFQPLHGGRSAKITIQGNQTVEGRFYITFLKSSPSDERFALSQEIAAKINVFQNNRVSQLEIHNPEVIDIKNAAVYDMRGRLVISEKNLGKQSQYSFSTANLSDGMYIVKLTTVDDVVVDYKAMIQNRK